MQSSNSVTIDRHSKIVLYLKSFLIKYELIIKNISSTKVVLHMVD